MEDLRALRLLPFRWDLVVGKSVRHGLYFRLLYLVVPLLLWPCLLFRTIRKSWETLRWYLLNFLCAIRF
jgi:hypothetical protein